MKKTFVLLMTLALALTLCCGAFAESYSVGVCQLMVHESPRPGDTRPPRAFKTH